MTLAPYYAGDWGGNFDLTPQIVHSDISSYAKDRVNLPRDRAQRYRDQVNALRERLANKIEEDPEFDLVKMLHSGSVAKGTALSIINDLDVAVYVKKTNAPGEESDLLDWLAERLKEANPQLQSDQFSAGTHCVTVNFKGSGLDVDVVPVLYEGDEDDRGFLLNRDTGEWLETSVRLHLDFIRKRKASVPNHFAEVIRLMKWWVNHQKTLRAGFRFKSFMVELICASRLDNGQLFSDYPGAMESIFSYIVKSELRERITFSDFYSPTSIPAGEQTAIQIYDPVNPENNVAANYSDIERQAIVDASNDALDALTEAHHSDTKGRAVSLWKDVFGPSFRG